MASKKLKFHLTAHFIQRMKERDVDLDACKEAIRNPDQKHLQRRGVFGGNIYMFRKSSPNGSVIVIAESKKDEIWIMTTWIDTNP